MSLGLSIGLGRSKAFRPKFDATHDPKAMKHGQRVYGYFLTLSSGLKVYVATRQFSDIFCERQGSMSEALRKGVATWAIDTDTLIRAKVNKFDMIAVMVKDDPVLYVSPINWWFEDYVQPRAVGHDYSLRGGSSQKRVFLYRFARVQPESLGIIVSP